MTNAVQFSPFSVLIHPNYWGALSELKLNVFGLDESERLINGFYVNSCAPGLDTRLQVDFNAFDVAAGVPEYSFGCPGSVLLTNTIENFKELDRATLLKTTGQKIWKTIESGECLSNPSLLSHFIFTCFADLKKHKYYHWLAFPAILFPKDVNLVCPIATLRNSFPDFDASNKLNSIITGTPGNFDRKAAFILLMTDESWNDAKIVTLDRIKEDFGNSQVILVVSDPSTCDFPGWPVRNLLAAWAYHRPSSETCRVLCLRRRYIDGVIDCGHSLLVNISYTIPCVLSQSFTPGFVGWVRNANNQLAPQITDMSATLDPIKVARSAVDLNLQLMRWRLVPELDLNIMTSLKCVLFGAGTLGCNVARMLMAWGVRNITFVDNATVSYSNPVRQSLYKFSDSIGGKTKKAFAAKQAVLDVVPSANVEAIDITVPMPGHAVDPQEVAELKAAVSKVDELVQSHDVIFMLMDSREGRWLPALLAAVYQKVALSMALGFDSYVVLRHGVRGDATSSTVGSSCHPGSIVPGPQLGCYFCSDVTAPGNSVRDRTLDQQCTVTRPGVSSIAAGVGVELLSTLLQHPLRGAAPAVIGTADDDVAESACSCLGAVPHQIRGYLSRFQQITPCVQRFESCIACSEQVVDLYKSRGSDFILDVCNDPSILEKITGLTELQQATETMQIWELSDSESVKSMDQ